MQPPTLSQYQCHDSSTHSLIIPQPFFAETQSPLCPSHASARASCACRPTQSRPDPASKARTLRSAPRERALRLRHRIRVTAGHVGAMFSAPAARLPRTARVPAFRADAAAPAAAPARCRLLRRGGVARAGGAASASPAPAPSPLLTESSCIARARLSPADQRHIF